MKNIYNSSRKSRILIGILGFTLVIIIGILDYLIGPDLSSLLAYLIPVIVITRFVGRIAGICASLASAISWVLADMLADPNYTFQSVLFWNHLEKLAIFLIIIFILIKLAQIEEERKNMIAMLAHDMKNPTLVAKGFSSRLLDGKTGSITKRQENHIQLIHKELGRLEHLILDFLEISKLESNKFKLHTQPLDILHTIQNHVETVSVEAERKNLQIIIDSLDEDVPLVNADRDQIDRVFRNLLGNAINYTDDGGTITIEVLAKNKYILIKIRDTGRGIPKEHIKNIFKPFHRIRNDPGGTGLGLPIVKALIRAHGGKIWVESIPGKGSTFIFTLPLFDAAHQKK